MTMPERALAGAPLLLSNGPFETLVTPGGGGYAAWGGLALTRYTPDATTDADGIELYVRDARTGVWWQPNRDAARVTFRTQQAVFEGEQDGIAFRLTVALSPQTPCEVRRLVLTNTGARPRQLEVTTYAEFVLNTPDADRGHPAFSKLFVQTDYEASLQAIVAERRLRSPDDTPLAVAHTLVPDSGLDAPPDWGTDRMLFLGRGRSRRNPQGLAGPLGQTAGAVLDPVAALRRTVEVTPGASVALTACTAAGASRVHALAALFPCLSGARADGVLKATRGPVERVFEKASPAAPRFQPAAAVWPADETPRPADELLFDNGYGGFADGGRAYRIRVFPGRHLPPLPWTNVLASEHVGCIVSEQGIVNSWSVNSRENRLSPWANDPVTDPPGEWLFARDESAGAYWSLTPGPAGLPAWHAVTHGWGFTRYETQYGGLDQRVEVSVAPDACARVAEITITNTGSAPRRLTVFAYNRLVLGVLPHVTAPHVETWAEGDTLFAHNPARGEFAHRVAFSALHGAGEASHTTWRPHFVGPGGSEEAPLAVTHSHPLDGDTGIPGDPCFAHARLFTLAPGETWQGAWVLGEAETDASAARTAADLAPAAARRTARDAAVTYWQGLAGAVHVETPAPELDLMLNGWLLYQNLACRILARSAFYQSGGAYGFRDQLQDSSALLFALPERARSQLLLHAAHQFPEGDVLHWWHPPLSKGMRTRFSDDLLWLPLLAAHYVEATGDGAVLDEKAPFVEAPPLEKGEDEVFLVPTRLAETATLYEHACRALDRSLTQGAHGLPLMGVGDWNDGMNRVGREGRGESVWLGFFLYDILGRWLPFVEARGDGDRARRYRDYREHLLRRLNADSGGWDGAWYRRAYYDNGAPLGSHQNDECQIDALAQAWAVLSGAAPPERARQALDALEARLVDGQAGIIRLLTPAFDQTPHDPGYIKGYLPGVRENGGQYTHAAMWAVRAFAQAGRCNRAAPLLEMLSPVAHTATRKGADIYKAEPYVVAADVYGVAPHVGRGGWTWYTGSAGWMYRVGVESILGLRLEGGTHLRIQPCIPDAWPGFTATLRLPGGPVVRVQVENPEKRAARVVEAEGAGVEVEGGSARLRLAREGEQHVRVVMGP